MTDLISDAMPAITAHGAKVVAGDVRKLLRDFESDRAAQLLGSVSVPPDGVRDYTVESTEETAAGEVTARIRYTAQDGDTFVLRSRWRARDGIWQIFQVRNLPETPPRLGTEGPSPDGLDEPYWQGLRDGELRLPQCAQCDNWVWGPSPICPQCHSFDLDWRPVEPVGNVYSWTRTWQPFATEASGHLPYVVVLVELPQAGYRRVLGVLRDADGVRPAIGMAVRGEIQAPDTDDGWPLLRWRQA
jgi:uncharacterized OB-fold protein